MENNILTYLIEENNDIKKYILSFDENELNDFINNLYNYDLESNHVYVEGKAEKKESQSSIKSTESLVKFLRDIITNRLLNLNELNKLFNDYDNQMYSPATMQLIKDFFNLMHVKSSKAISSHDFEYIYRRLIKCGRKVEEIDKKMQYAKYNTIAFKRLGLNLKNKTQNKVLKKAIN